MPSLGIFPVFHYGRTLLKYQQWAKLTKLERNTWAYFPIRNFALRDLSERDEGKTLPGMLWNSFPKGFTSTTQGYLKIFETLHNAYKTIQMSKPWRITRKCGCWWFPEKCFHHTNTVEGEIKEKERHMEPWPYRVRNPSIYNCAELTHWQHQP